MARYRYKTSAARGRQPASLLATSVTDPPPSPRSAPQFLSFPPPGGYHLVSVVSSVRLCKSTIGTRAHARATMANAKKKTRKKLPKRKIHRAIYLRETVIDPTVRLLPFRIYTLRSTIPSSDADRTLFFWISLVMFSTQPIKHRIWFYLFTVVVPVPFRGFDNADNVRNGCTRKHTTRQRF